MNCFRSSLDGATQAAAVTLRSLLAEVPGPETGEMKNRIERVLREAEFMGRSNVVPTVEDLDSVLKLVSSIDNEPVMTLDELDEPV